MRQLPERDDSRARAGQTPRAPPAASWSDYLRSAEDVRRYMEAPDRLDERAEAVCREFDL